MPPYPHATTLHFQSLVIDTHNDSIVSHIRRGNQSFDNPNRRGVGPDSLIAWLRGPLDGSVSATEVQLNFPKMIRGGVDCSFFHVDVSRAWKNHLAYALDGHGFFSWQLEEHKDVIQRVGNSSDIENAKKWKTCCDFGN